MIQLGLCLGVIQVLLYGAGIATGVLVGPASRNLPGQIPPLAVVVAEKGSAPAMSAPVIPSQPAPAPASQQPPATSNDREGGMPMQALAGAAPAAAEASELDSHLAVQVASFHDKENALRLAAVLKRQGFGPVTVGQYDSRSATWHFVRLGPFRAWEDASRVAAELDRSYDLRAYVLPAGIADN
jgi:cell division septation protein DedD